MKNPVSANPGRNFIDHKQYEELSDKQVIQRVMDGEIRMFEVILRRYNQTLYRVTRSYLSDEEQCREIVQRAYVRAYEHLDQFRAEAQFSTWLIRITINEALRYIKQENRFTDHEIQPPESRTVHESLIDQEDPEHSISQSDLNRLLQEAIDSLPSKYRSVFIMREIEQMNTRDTADSLNISRSNVKVRLHRAKNMLQEKLKGQVIEADILEFKGKRCDTMVATVMDTISG